MPYVSSQRRLLLLFQMQVDAGPRGVMNKQEVRAGGGRAADRLERGVDSRGEAPNRLAGIDHEPV